MPFSHVLVRTVVTFENSLTKRQSTVNVDIFPVGNVTEIAKCAKCVVSDETRAGVMQCSPSPRVTGDGERCVTWA